MYHKNITICLKPVDTAELAPSSILINSAYWVIFHASLSKINFSKKSSRNTIRVSNSLDPDQARHFVRPDLGPNCLQRLSADNTDRHTVILPGQEYSDGMPGLLYKCPLWTVGTLLRLLL